MTDSTAKRRHRGRQTLSPNQLDQEFAQAAVLRPWMAPHTQVIARRAELMEAVGYCGRYGIAAVVSKQEGMHCGHGVRRWESAEALYNAVAFDGSAYPFVLQPFLPDISDVRVIVAGDYVEAYVRENPFNFRANLAAGGAGRPLAMDPAAERLCRDVMKRGRYPYAHIDLHLTPGGQCWLSEITLEGGIAAADPDGRLRLRELIEQILAQDPRPGYMDRYPERDRFALRLYNLEVRWRVEGRTALVEAVPPYRVSTPSDQT